MRIIKLDPEYVAFVKGRVVDKVGESGIIKETENQKLLKDKIKSGELRLKSIRINRHGIFFKMAKHQSLMGEVT